MFYQLYDHRGEIIDTSNVILGDYSLAHELDNSPSLDLKIPICYLGCLNQRVEIAVVPEDGTYFRGELTAYDADPKSNTVTASFEHILYEWRRESVPIGVVKKNATVRDLMADRDIVYHRRWWDIAVTDNSNIIEFEFSRETKRDALDKIINMTTELHYRVPRQSQRRLEIGLFGEEHPFRITESNIIGDLKITADRGGIVNFAVALADKSDSGGTSTTLREMFMHPEKQLPRFPIVATDNKINTAAQPFGYRYPEYAPNNDTEYAVIDEEGIELEHGEVYEGTFNSNSVAPIQKEGKEITNEDRIKASEMLYQIATRKLRASRAIVKTELTVPDLPPDVNVGDKIRVDVGNGNFCINDWLYIVAITESATASGQVSYSLVLQDSLTDLVRVKES